MNKEHKYKDKDEYKDNDKDKDAKRITVYYIFKNFARVKKMTNMRYGEVDQGEVSTIRLGMLESSGFRKYSTLLVTQLFSPRLCLCHCLCICLCLCICVPYSFLNSYYHKLSENVWV